MIHKFKAKDLNIVLDVNSGGVHLVDDMTYDLLDYIEEPLEETCPQKALDELSGKYTVEQLKECYGEILELYHDKVLFSGDPYAVYAETAINSPIKAMCLHISHDCNLRCKYCFASTGDFGTGRKLMPLETAKAAIDFLLEKSVGRENLELDFFGGEPLMNFDVVKQTVAYARSKEKEYGKNFRFTITTNGMLLDDDAIDFINKEMYNVVLSIDGRKEVNDRMRPRVDGKGSYDKIIPMYKKLVDQRGEKEYYVRGTYTKYNLDFSDDVFALLDAGFDQISVEPVIADAEEPYAITEADLPRIFEEYERLMQKILDYEATGKKFNFFHFMLDLDQGPCAIKRLRGCGCGNEYVAITPDGDIYPCHQFVGEEDFLMGNVDEGIVRPEIADEFRGCSVYSKEKCKNCFAKFYCSGGCMANSYKFHGSIHDAYDIGCELQKKRIECAIMIKAAMAEEEV